MQQCLGCWFSSEQTRERRFSVPAGPFLTVGAVSAGLAAIWFTGIQVFHLEHLCPWCLGAHSCGVILAAIVLWHRPFSFGSTSALSGISAVGIAGLIAAQVMIEPEEQFTVETYEDPATEASTDDEGVQMAAFESPMDFEAPVEFASPVEFAPPAADDSLFAPPVTDDAGSDDHSEAAKPERQAKAEEDVPVQASADRTEEPGLSAVAASSLIITAPRLSSLLMQFVEDTPAENSTEDSADTSAAKEVAAKKTYNS